MVTSSAPPVETAESFATLAACLIHAGFVTSDDWVAWATDELMRADGAPAWLAELTTTYSVNDALALVVAGAEDNPTVEDDLGCLWLAFQDKRVTSIELLEKSLEVAGGWDTGGGFIPYQRELMALLRRVEDLPYPVKARPGDTLAAIESDTRALLSPLGQRVRQRAAGRLKMSALQNQDFDLCPSQGNG